MGSVEARIPNRREAMTEIAAMIAAFGQEHGLSRGVIHDVSVSLDEVLNNVISYAFEAGARSEIGVRLQITDGKIIVDVDDGGRPFDPLSAPPPDFTGGLQQRRVGGLGIYFVRNLMDSVEYARVGDRNWLRLKKALAPDEREELGGE
jgi:serine/threonine-protein kinase RsbW/sigma-B regulation protein RsbU (phosphoserine phosphatase)